MLSNMIAIHATEASCMQDYYFASCNLLAELPQKCTQYQMGVCAKSKVGKTLVLLPWKISIIGKYALEIAHSYMIWQTVIVFLSTITTIHPNNVSK